jgi:dihydroorotate dehydrogenase electron transfer subunit
MTLLQRHEATDASPATGKTQETDTRVKSNTPVNGEYRLLVLDAPQSILNCQPGQFFHLLCPVTSAHQPYLRRPMSIYGYSAQKGELQFLYKVTGEGTRALAELKIGDTLNVLGPLGVGFSIEPDWQNLLLLARGVGLATLAPLAQKAKRVDRKLTAICSARSQDVLMSVDYFEEMGAEVITLTDADGTSDMNNMRRVIESKISEGAVDAMYTCGSNRMLHLLQEIGATHNIPGEIALEQQMACGLGMCQCCVRSFNRQGLITQERVCREGPVFGIQDAMAW